MHEDGAGSLAEAAGARPAPDLLATAHARALPSLLPLRAIPRLAAKGLTGKPRSGAMKRELRALLTGDAEDFQVIPSRSHALLNEHGFEPLEMSLAPVARFASQLGFGGVRAELERVAQSDFSSEHKSAQESQVLS